MQKAIKIAVIGCGRIAQGAHFPALAKLKDVKIKYACDLIEEKAVKVKGEYGCEIAITDYKKALADPEIEAVYVLTPNTAHYEITMAALNAGKHVFCEKPVAINFELVKEMADAAKKNGKLLNIGVCNRYNKSIELIEKMNRNKEFGDIYHVYCSFRSYRSIPGLGGAFTTKAESGGGVLIDWGVHFFDLILYILGGAVPKTVTCDIYSEMAKNIKDYIYTSMWAEDTMNPDGTNDVDDMVSGYIRTDKASISFNGAWAQNIGENEMFVDFLGDKGGVRLTYGKDFDIWTTENGTLVKKHPIFKQNNHYEAENEAFISAIRSGEHTKTYIDNILESSKLLDALYESAKNKKEIRL